MKSKIWYALGLLFCVLGLVTSILLIFHISYTPPSVFNDIFQVMKVALYSSSTFIYFILMLICFLIAWIEGER